MDERHQGLPETEFDALNPRRNEGELYEDYRIRLRELKTAEKFYKRGMFPWQRVGSNVTVEEYMNRLNKTIEDERTRSGHVDNIESGQHPEGIEPNGDLSEEGSPKE